MGARRCCRAWNLLPAEKMLAAVDPGYSFLAVTSLIDTHLNNGTLRFARYIPDTPTGVAYGEALSDLFYEAAPVKEFRKRYRLEKLPGTKYLAASGPQDVSKNGAARTRSRISRFWNSVSLSKPPNPARARCWRDFSGAKAIRWKSFRRTSSNTGTTFCGDGDFPIDLIFRRIKVQEFLVRFDLTHPLLRAYREHAVCVVNSFRSELAQKKAIFDLLTDEEITGEFPGRRTKDDSRVCSLDAGGPRNENQVPQQNSGSSGVHSAPSPEAGAASERRGHRPAIVPRLRTWTTPDGKKRLRTALAQSLCRARG